MLMTVVGGHVWNKLPEADRKIFTEVMKEAGMRATNAIVANEKRLVGGFEKLGKTVVKVDRAPFQAAAVKELTGPSATWPKDMVERIQAIR